MAKDTQTDALSNHERYLQGKPLTQELEEIRGGTAAQPPRILEIPAGQTQRMDSSRPLTNADRADLRELIASPGWGVLKRLREKNLHIYEKAAMAISKSDPLAHAEEIAKAWAIVQIAERIARDENVFIYSELQAQEEEKKA